MLLLGQMVDGNTETKIRTSLSDRAEGGGQTRRATT
jgi:hypothetical protein